MENIKTLLKDVIMQSEAIVKTSFESPTIVSRKAYLYSVFYNLISNAIEYWSEQAPLIKITMAAKNETAHIRVVDNRIGIDMDKHVVKPYRRLNFNTEGKGLGLFFSLKPHRYAER